MASVYWYVTSYRLTRGAIRNNMQYNFTRITFFFYLMLLFMERKRPPFVGESCSNSSLETMYHLVPKWFGLK